MDFSARGQMTYASAVKRSQGRTTQETIEIERDVARKLIEAQSSATSLPPARDVFKYPLIIAS